MFELFGTTSKRFPSLNDVLAVSLQASKAFA